MTESAYRDGLAAALRLIEIYRERPEEAIKIIGNLIAESHERSRAASRARIKSLDEPMGPPARNRVVCGWCGFEMSPGVEPVSHGVCSDCKDEQLRISREV